MRKGRKLIGICLGVAVVVALGTAFCQDAQIGTDTPHQPLIPDFKPVQLEPIPADGHGTYTLFFPVKPQE